MKTTTVTKSEKQEEIENMDEKTIGNTLVMASGILFAIICALSAFFFFENMRLSSSIEANKNTIAEYTSSIEKIQSDKKIIAAELVTANKPGILQMIAVNEAQKYIGELIGISKKYKLIFSGFSYENGKVTTSAVSIPETVLFGDDGVKKISQFIGDYRTGSGLLFDLSPVFSISGYEQKRNFSIEFSVHNFAR